MTEIATIYPAICTNHNPVALCGCGLNTICHTCGQGSGSAPCNCAPPARALGLSKGTIQIADDFGAPMELVDSERLAFLEALERLVTARGEWEALKRVIDEDRLSDRALFLNQ